MRSDAEDHNDSWWPPAARPRPLVSDGWLKLDLLLKQQQGYTTWGMRRVGRHPCEMMAVSRGPTFPLPRNGGPGALSKTSSVCRINIRTKLVVHALFWLTYTKCHMLRQTIVMRLPRSASNKSILWSSDTSVLTLRKGKWQSWVLLIVQ